MLDEGSQEHQSSLAAPVIFIVVMAFQYASWWLEKLKKNASKTEKAMQLHAEIKQLLREAGTLSQPSTFAQAAKLRRQAAAKEKELANYQDLHGKEVKLSYDLYLKVLFSSKVFVYIVLVFWFWRAPVAIISQQLVQPLGGLLSWWGGGVQNNNVMVGIIPWLIVSSRVCKFICRLLK